MATVYDRRQDELYRLSKLALALPDHTQRAIDADFHDEKRAQNYETLRPLIDGAPRFDQLRDDLIAKKGRVLLIGSGPSFKKNLEIIRKYSEKFVLVAADKAADKLRGLTSDRVYVITVDSDPLGLLAKTFDAQAPYPDNFICLAQAYSAPEVVRKFKTTIFFTTTYYASSLVRKIAKDFPTLPLIPTASSCMGTAYVVAFAAGASMLVAIGIDLSFGQRVNAAGGMEWDVPEEDLKHSNFRLQLRVLPVRKQPIEAAYALGSTILGRTDKWAVTVCKEQDATGHMLSTVGYLEAVAQFNGIISQTQAERNVKVYDLGDGLFPAPKVKANELWKRVKHGEL